MIEIERKFLVRLPYPWYAQFFLHNSTHINIVQTYIHTPYLNEKGNVVSRVRRLEYHNPSTHTMVNAYYSTGTKTFIDNGLHHEEERTIDSSEYFGLISNYRDYTRKQIFKRRHIITYDQKRFELDVFQNTLSGLAILELELPSIEHLQAKVKLPSFLDVIKEITDDSSYSNYNLARLDANIPDLSI